MSFHHKVSSIHVCFDLFRSQVFSALSIQFLGIVFEGQSVVLSLHCVGHLVPPAVWVGHLVPALAMWFWAFELYVCKRYI